GAGSTRAPSWSWSARWPATCPATPCPARSATSSRATEHDRRGRGSAALQLGLDAAPEAARVHRRIAEELRLDPREQLERAGRLDETPARHLAHVLDVLHVASLELGQRLRVRIEMEEVDGALAGDEDAAVLPARERRDEVRRRRQLDAQLEALLQRGDG